MILIHTIRVLIADSVDDFRLALTDALQNTCTVRSAADGSKALQLMHDFVPDILVLDMMMPGMDGISLLQKAAQQGLCPAVLATTCYLSNYLLHACSKMGVNYLMVKPCDIQAAADRVIDMIQQMDTPIFSHPEPRTLVSNVLLQLGIPAKLRGYSYLREAVLLTAKQPHQSITKELYPAIAAQYDVTAIQVERSIRTAIHTAWNKRDASIWRNYLPSCADGSIPRPTNASFICHLAEYMTLQAGQTA